MADSFTANLNLRKPEVGAATDTWGGVAGLNGDLDLIDAVFLATGLGTSVGLRVGAGRFLNAHEGSVVTDAQGFALFNNGATFRTNFNAEGLTGHQTLTLPNASGTIATELAVVNAIAATVPPGVVMHTASQAAAPPPGWLLCDGAAVSRTTYAALFTALASGAVYGAGDGSTTFNVPDLRGRVVAGGDPFGTTGRLTNPNAATLGAAGGAQTVTLTQNEMPAHTHGFITGNSPATNTGRAGYGDGNNLANVFTESAGAGGAHANVQPTIVLWPIIKT